MPLIFLGAHRSFPLKPKSKTKMKTTRTCRALIVDDDPALRRLLSRFLSLLRWSVQTVPTGAAALEVFAAGKFDVAVCDINIGHGVDGVALANRLRQMDLDIKIIMVSGNPSNFDRARRIGFSRCLAKPFTLEDFRAAVEVAPEAAMRKPARLR